MDKEQIVKDMLQYSGYCAEHNCEDCFGCREQAFAKDLVKNGYGNIEQALNEFAERFNELCKIKLEPLCWEYGDGAMDVINIFNETLRGFPNEQ